MNQAPEPKDRPEFVPPSRLAAVHFPSGIFFCIDFVLLVLAKTPLLKALIITLLTTALMWWLVDRRFARLSRKHIAHHNPTGQPPAGSWSNPTTAQKYSRKWSAISEVFMPNRAARRRRYRR